MTPGDVVLYEAGLPGRPKRTVWGAVLKVDDQWITVAGLTLRPKRPHGAPTTPLRFRGGDRATFAFGPPELKLRANEVLSVVTRLGDDDWATIRRLHASD